MPETRVPWSWDQKLAFSALPVIIVAACYEASHTHLDPSSEAQTLSRNSGVEQPIVTPNVLQTSPMSEFYDHESGYKIVSQAGKIIAKDVSVSTVGN